MIGYIVAAVVFLVSCVNSEDRDLSDSKGEKSQPSSPKPEEGPSYSITVDGENLNIYHKDKNGDKKFQPETESLTLGYGDKFSKFGDASFGEAIGRFGLPDFEKSSLPLDQWHKAHQWIFSNTTSTAGAEKQFSEVTQNAGGELGSILLLAGALKTRTPREKLIALDLSETLFHASSKAPVFYRNNQAFLDRALTLIAGGHLTIVDETGAAKKDVSELHVAATYKLEIDTITYQKLNKNPFRAGIHLHELVHFLQDSQARDLTEVDTEVGAYQIEGDYLLEAFGLTNSADSQKLEKVILENYPPSNDDNNEPSAFAIRYAYAKFYKTGDEQSALEALRMSVISSYSTIVFHPAIAQAKKLISSIRTLSDLENSSINLQRASVLLEKKLDELLTNTHHNGTPKNTEEVFKALSVYLSNAVAAILLDEMQKQVKSKDLTVVPAVPDISLNDPRMQKILQKIISAGLVEKRMTTHDGVGRRK